MLVLMILVILLPDVFSPGSPVMIKILALMIPAVQLMDVRTLLKSVMIILFVPLILAMQKLENVNLHLFHATIKTLALKTNVI
jgi:hypothetical protein